MLAVLLVLATGGDTVPLKDSLAVAHYWQQQVAYVISAALDEPSGVLTGQVRIAYVNRSPDTLHDFFVHQYLNAFRPGSRWAAADSAEGRVRFQAHLLDRGDAQHQIQRAVPIGEGAEISPATLAGTCAQAGALLVPLADAITERSRGLWHLHADETTWRVFAPRDGDGPAKWWLWVFTAPRGAVSYRSRSGQGWEEVSPDLMAYSGPKG